MARRKRKGISRPEIGRYHAARQAAKKRRTNNKQTRIKVKDFRYCERDEILVEMGFASYQEYLSSFLWSRIRSSAFVVHGNTCAICAASATQIHHLAYTLEVLLGKDLRPLVPVCDGCHNKIEFTEDGVKRSMSKAGKVFNTLTHGRWLYNQGVKFHQLRYQRLS